MADRRIQLFLYNQDRSRQMPWHDKTFNSINFGYFQVT